MNTKNRLQPQRHLLSPPLSSIKWRRGRFPCGLAALRNRPIGTDCQELMKKLTRCAGIAAVILFPLCVGHAGELPRPGEAIDAGDSYRLKDGSRVVLHRLVN